MDPISIGLGIAGLGMQLFGGLGQASVAKQSAQVSGNIAQQEQGINAQKLQQMQLEANRANLQNFRNVQQVKSAGLASAVSGGAEFGSGLKGAQASETDQGLYNSLGINQNLQIGQNIAGYNANISADKMQLASLGGQSATDQGISSLGGALLKAGPTIGAFSKGVGGVNFNGLFGGGSPTGYGA